MMKRLVTSLIVVLLLPAAAGAQENRRPRLLHKTVRVELADGRMVTGKVEGESVETLTIGDVSYAKRDLREVRIADGIGDGAGKGFMVGALFGILVGGLGSSVTTEFANEANFKPGVPPAESHETRDAIVAGLMTGGIGALIGMGIDKAHTHFDRTVMIFGATTTFSPVATMHSVGVNGSVRW